ncbi:MAG: hypothetical protein OEQ53_02815 [Saprospiraceae bacterium]|nr:hypothetical protein [Saprospiraceae bacterium]
MYFKSIFQGNLHFGNAKTYDKVVKMYAHRLENYYKMDVAFEMDEIFLPESYALHVPRYVGNLSEKSWKNTVDLLTYVAQFAISGNVGAWMTDQGKILKYAWIEPEGDKAAVQTFLRGRKLIAQKGREEEGQKALTQAIEIYNKHAQAYERRGYVNYLLKKYHDAERDFTKSINLDKSNAPAYHGRARIKMLREEWVSAIEDLNMAIKTSLALQDIHWIARRLKSECHMKLREWQEAEFELRFFTKRTFRHDSGNYAFRRLAFFNYGKVLLEQEKYADALIAFDQVLQIKEGQDTISEAEKLLFRGIARKHAGKNGYLSDWNEASKLGSTQAVELLDASK